MIKIDQLTQCKAKPRTYKKEVKTYIIIFCLDYLEYYISVSRSNKMSTLSTTSSLVTRPIVTGLLNAAMSYYLIPYKNVSVPLFGSAVSTPLLFGAMSAASNLATGAITQNLLPAITSNPMILNNNMIVEPVVSGATNVAIAYLLAPQLLRVSDVGAAKLFASGAVAEIGGGYASKYIHGMGY